MVATTMLVVETLVTDGLRALDMNRHNMNEWDIPVPEIMHRMEEARLELDNSTGDFILGRDTRYVTGQFLLRTDGMFEQHGLPDLLFGNVPYPFMESAGSLLGILGCYQYARRDDVDFVNGLIIEMEGDEYILKQYVDNEGDIIPNVLEVVSTQEEVDYCACCENNKHIGE